MKRQNRSITNIAFVTEDTDLSDPESDDEDISQKMYMEACKDMNLTPIKAVYKALDTEKLAIVGVILKKKEAKACAIGLVVIQLN
jgi:hypothetical protein